MIKSSLPKKQISFLTNISFCFCLLITGCISTPQKISLDSKNLTFKTRIHYSSPDLNEKSFSISSWLFIQEEQFLRWDFFQTFVGTVARFFLHEKMMILVLPFKKKYYKGEFNSQIFFPNLPSFPGNWLFTFLRGQAPDDWDCQKKEDIWTHCTKKHWTVNWEYKNSQLSEIQLRDSQKRQIRIQVKSISSQKLDPNIFKAKLNSFKRETNPSFFKSSY